ncbi:MAG: FAD-dependent oxidoreductase [Balneolaceae bacterium]|nr:FAD-dependent oxidoreductase [Balneolaceae bacterium]
MNPTDSVLDWIIVGGGIHGTYLSNVLIKKRVTGRDNLRVIDPHDEALTSWKRVTENVGMEYLRSPKVHHLDLEPFSLKHYSQCTDCSERQFIAPNDRPSLSLFNHHAESVIRRNGLEKLRVKEWAVRIDPGTAYHTVHTEYDCLKAKNLILATGSGSAEWPLWAINAMNEGALIQHVLDPKYDANQLPTEAEILVVGGGMSAVQTALSISTEKRRVTLVSPHSLRMNNYDSDPGWMGPKYLRKFRSVSCFTKRRKLIEQARNRGTVTSDLYHAFRNQVKKVSCVRVVDSIISCTVLTEGLNLLQLQSGEKLACNAIVLATGYRNRRPGGEMISRLIDQYNLRCSACGYPVPQSNLEWFDRIYLSGPLAELEVGPAAQNVIGARMAAEKILNMY